jgi:hypothetical protein
MMSYKEVRVLDRSEKPTVRALKNKMVLIPYAM